MERESGYYWVKNENIWYVAKYNKDYFAWSISGVEATFTDVDFEEIDERRIARQHKHFENFVIEPYAAQISPMTDDEKEKFNKIIDEAMMQAILEFRPIVGNKKEQPFNGY